MNWRRLEGGHIDPEMTGGMSAAIADPLWLLARQWQVGEFRGEDAASPVLLDADLGGAAITQYWVDGPLGRSTVSRTDVAWPLETHAEHEPVVTGPAAARLALESGAELLAALRRAGAGETLIVAVREAYADGHDLEDPLDPVGTAQLALLARRVPDGGRVAAALDAVGGDPANLPELAGQPDALLAAVTRWRAHQATRFCEVGPGEQAAWDATRLEYRFGLSAKFGSNQVDLVAPEYPGGTLDWYHFDVATDDGPPPGKPERWKHLTVLPTPLQFAGMPASRWWEFEDHDVDFGDMPGGPEDLARSVLAAFAMVAGDDWFQVPCELPAGSLTWVERVRILDDFGLTTTVRPAAALDAAAGGPRPWRFFELHDDPGPANGRAPMLLLPPVVHATEAGRPVEQVEFRRDEMANLAWAIEHRVESRAGRTIDRRAPRTPPGEEPPAEVDPDAWRYRLATDVPDNWVPLVPVRIDGDRPQIALRRGRLAFDGEAPRAVGRILEPEHAFVVHEEEIPNGGVRVERRWQLARGADGAVRLWMGRKKSPSGGPLRRTPLRFDHLTGYRHRPRT